MARCISRSYSRSPELSLLFEVMTFPKISGYWLVTCALTVGGAVFAWYNGESIDPSPYKRMMYVFAIGAFAILARAKFIGGWRQAVRIAPREGAKKHEREASARAKSTASTDADAGSSRREKLETALRDRHGRRWRYRDRWIAIVGDEKVVERMTPGLIESGFLVSDSTVLLYARQSGDSLDTNWLEQIRAMRRGRPIDAMVALEQSIAQSGARFPADANHVCPTAHSNCSSDMAFTYSSDRPRPPNACAAD
jgi:type VI secretion system protein ImpL